MDSLLKSIRDDKFVVVDYECLKLIGYDNSTNNKNKQMYKKLLKESFPKAFEEVPKTDKRIKTNGNERLLLVVQKPQFIESLRMVNTKAANDILDQLNSQSRNQLNIKPQAKVQAQTPTLEISETKKNKNINLDKSQELSNTLETLDIYKFIESRNYDIDKLYIDKFWNNLNNDIWIVIDKEILKWIGYNCALYNDNKRLYQRILQNNDLVLGEDYDIIDQPTDYEPRTKSKIEQKKTIIVSNKAFELSLLITRTKKASSIRRYYQLLGTIMKDYLIYTNEVKEHNLRLENEQLRNAAKAYKQIGNNNSDMFDINTKKLIPNEYVYVLTSKRYYRKSLFKIGKSVKPNKRIISHNTTAATDEDTMFYTHVIPTLDCGALEKTLHALLERYHHSKEWYKLPQVYLLRVINEVVRSQNEIISIVNEQLETNDFNNVEAIPMEDFIANKMPTIEDRGVSPEAVDMLDESKPEAIIDSSVVENNNSSVITQPSLTEPEAQVINIKKCDTHIIYKYGIMHCSHCHKKFLKRTTAEEHINSCS